MQCENCGRPLRLNETICPMCGEPVWPEEPEQTTLNARRGIRPGALQVGPPVDPYAPTVFGPQAPLNRRTPPLQAPRYTPSQRPPRPRMDDGASYPFWPSPEESFAARRPRRRWNAGCLPLVGLAAGLVVVALLVTGALAATGQLPGMLGGGTSPSATGQQPQAHASATTRPTVAPTATATAVPICPRKPVDSAAAKALKNVQLSSGLHNPNQQDLRPVNALTTFHPGQTVYVTFQIATNQPGTIAADLCTPGNRFDGSKAVPPDFAGGRGEFSTGTPLAAPQDLGAGMVTLTWDGAVAAVLPFQVANS